MRKIELPEREGWRAKAEELGFTFADMHGEPYWEESSAYEFSLEEIETGIEDPCTELHSMAREAVAEILASEELMARLAIPEEHRDLVADSWKRAEPEIYGRFDLAWDGTGPAKMLEYNADTPTSLYESASFQWSWLEDQIAAGVLPEDADQFNGIHEALVERFRGLFPPNTDLHFTAMGGNPEDYATVECMAWAAREAGMGAHYSDLEKIAVSTKGQFLDAEDRVIGTLFKLYPWEDLLREDFSRHLVTSGCLMLEPAWKAVVSNKGLLPVLWRMYAGHPNLLPAFFEDEIAGGAPEARRAADALGRGHVTKPLFSREGAAIRIVENGVETEASPEGGYGAHPKIVQAYHPLPEFGGFRPVLGAWIVGEACVGLGVREDRGRITQDLSRFKPHYIR